MEFISKNILIPVQVLMMFDSVCIYSSEEIGLFMHKESAQMTNQTSSIFDWVCLYMIMHTN